MATCDKIILKVNEEVKEIITVGRQGPPGAGAEVEIDPSDSGKYLTNDGSNFVWTDLVVKSLNGQTGDIVLETDSVPEGTENLYFTAGRAISAIITSEDWNASEWDQAFSWGNHADAGYLKTTDLASVALTGDYGDLNNLPTLFSGNYNDLSNTPEFADIAFTGNYMDLSDRPSFAEVAMTGNYNDLEDKPIFQEPLVSGDNIKTINGQSILGSGNIVVEGGSGRVSSVNGQEGVVVLSASDVEAISVLERGEPGGVATLDSTGKLSATQMPDTSVAKKISVPDEAARLALEPYFDLTLAYQGDTGDTWALNANVDPSVPSNWERIGSAQALGVNSFNGRTGNVSPAAGDYTAIDVGAIPNSDRGVPAGVATLNASGIIPTSQLPAGLGRVQTVNGQEGEVELDTDDVPETTENMYLTPERYQELSVQLINLNPSVPAQVRQGDSLVLQLSAVSYLVGQSIESFDVVWPDTTENNYIADSAGNATASKEILASPGDTIEISITANDSLGNKARTIASVEVTANQPPIGPIVITYPSQVIAGSLDNEILFSGATDPEGDDIFYDITDSGSFTFSKTVGILENEIITFSAPSQAGSQTITVIARDSAGGISAPKSASIFVEDGQDLSLGVVLTTTGNNGGALVQIDSSGAEIPSPTSLDEYLCWNLVDEIIDGQYMVRVPKFYYKTGTVVGGVHDGLPAWWVSPYPREGYECHPAFMEQGQEIPYFWFSKYQGNIDAQGKLASVPGTTVNSNARSLNALKTNAENRNVGGVQGFQIVSYWHLCAIRILYLIENKSFNSQAVTGQGWVTNGTRLPPDDPRVTEASYRGITGLWGNIGWFADGLISSNAGLFVWDTQGNKTLVPLLPITRSTSAYPLTYYTDMLHGPGFFPSTTTTTITQSTTPDWFTAPTGGYVCFCGGNTLPGGAGAGDNAGLWYTRLYLTSTETSANVGGRLAKV